MCTKLSMWSVWWNACKINAGGHFVEGTMSNPRGVRWKHWTQWYLIYQRSYVCKVHSILMFGLKVITISKCWFILFSYFFHTCYANCLTKCLQIFVGGHFMRIIVCNPWEFSLSNFVWLYLVVRRTHGSNFMLNGIHMKKLWPFKNAFEA